MDGDRTPAAEDTGALLWDKVAELELSSERGNPLKVLFASSMGHTYTAFQQAALLYDDLTFTHGADIFDLLSEMTASAVTVRSELQALLELTTEHQHIGAIALTCGQGLIWEKVLKEAGLLDKVEVIGGG